MQNNFRRTGQWTREEDYALYNYVVNYGACRWDTVDRNLGLGRSGNSCRLRWVNYLSPDIRRGTFTDHEMLLILKLHYELGPKWSKIAEYLDRRTDNDIKNFWNTRGKREAKQLKCDVDSKEFLQIMTARIEAAAGAAMAVAAAGGGGGTAATVAASSLTAGVDHPNIGGAVADYPGDFWFADEELGDLSDMWNEPPSSI